MERADNDGSIMWRKIGGGGFRLRGRIIKPNQTFRATPDEIPKGFRDLVIPLEHIVKKEEPPLIITEAVYRLEPRGKSKSLFDVVDKNGKVLNEKALFKDKAEELIKQISG